MNFWETDLQERMFARSEIVLDQLADRMWINWARETVALARNGRHPAVSPMLLTLIKLTKDQPHGNRL